MRKIISFVSRPRNIYMSLVVMLTLVTALASISFSFYVLESSDKELRVSEVDNRISCDMCQDNEITVLAQQTIEVPIYVVSNNDFVSDYELYYITSSDHVDVVSYDGYDKTIRPKGIYLINLTIENYDTDDVLVKLGIESGYEGKEITVPGKKVLLG